LLLLLTKYQQVNISNCVSSSWCFYRHQLNQNTQSEKI